MGLDAIYNFVPLSTSLATAGQPSEAQLREVAAAGYQVVINLDVPDSRYALPDEPGLVQSLGMIYHNIPVNFGAPALVDLQHFMATLAANADKKVLVHCAANYRVASFIALYGQSTWDWTEAEADAHIRRLWEPNQTWSRFIEEARRQLGMKKAAS